MDNLARQFGFNLFQRFNFGWRKYDLDHRIRHNEQCVMALEDNVRNATLYEAANILASREFILNWCYYENQPWSPGLTSTIEHGPFKYDGYHTSLHITIPGYLWNT